MRAGGALALGQAALVSAAVAAALVAFRARSAAGAIGTTLLAALQPNPAVALIARVRSGWDVAVAAAAGAIFALLTLAGGAGAGVAAYLQHLAAHAAAERLTAIQHTPAAIAYAVGVPLNALPAVSAAIALGAAATAVALIVREHLDATTATLLACAALPLVLPFFHEHDFVLVLLPILVLAVRARGRARALASTAAALALVDWFGLAQRHAAQGQIVCLGLAVVFAFAAARPSAARGWRPDFAGILVLLALALVAVPLGRTHPAPTWPDTLPAGYRAPPAADASAVWGDEARAAGLTQREPAWGLLRSLPLLGCIVLGAALVRDARRRRPAAD